MAAANHFWDGLSWRVMFSFWSSLHSKTRVTVAPLNKFIHSNESVSTPTVLKGCPSFRVCTGGLRFLPRLHPAQPLLPHPASFTSSLGTGPHTLYSLKTLSMLVSISETSWGTLFHELSILSKLVLFVCNMGTCFYPPYRIGMCIK